jgi:hypothetical protein
MTACGKAVPDAESGKGVDSGAQAMQMMELRHTSLSTLDQVLWLNAQASA